MVLVKKKICLGHFSLCGPSSRTDSNQPNIWLQVRDSAWVNSWWGPCEWWQTQFVRPTSQPGNGTTYLLLSSAVLRLLLDVG